MTSAGSGGRRREAARTCPCPSRAARGRSDARTAAPRRPSAAQRARREHDFCLQAGFPPGHDGRGPPARSRQNVSGSPRTRARVAALPRALGRAAAAGSPPPNPRGGRERAAARGRPPALGLRRRRGARVSGRAAPGRAGTGVGVREPASGARGPGSGWGSGERGPGSGRRAAGWARAPGGERRAGDQVRSGEPDAGSGGPAGGARRAGRGVRVHARVI